MTTISLRRYTTLPFLLDILNKKCLTLLDPRSWEDKDDAYYIELYKQYQGLKSVLVLCFAESKASYHHWKIYSGNSSGVCIIFRKKILLQNLTVQGLRSGYVEYKTLTQLKRERTEISQFPFIKTKAFEAEREFRAIYEDKNNEYMTKEFQLDIKSIEKIALNPWLSESVCDSLKAVIKKIDGCEKIKVTRATVTNNEKWKKIGRAVILNNTPEDQ